MRKERLERIQEAQRQRAAAALRQQQKLALQRERHRQAQKERQSRAAEARKEAARKFEPQRAQGEREWGARWATLRQESNQRASTYRERQNPVMELQHFEREETRESAQRPLQGWGLDFSEEDTASKQKERELPVPTVLQSDVLTQGQQLLQHEWKMQQLQNQEHHPSLAQANKTA
ncbi:hypothetical protein cyc_01385 [Cyclospora cayetanensis]|uniref:Uncharacterized protein n=1 Tax=Cyclospora cayetanensis TaxID=88456 RepID=A0A1D3CXX4_9EIME|nr:hypothetical protein cyc_01385 [Cyclospora cayetanensis]